MSDNRTTELESLSKLKMAGKLRFWRGAIEIPEDELHAICDEIQAEHDRAIAATLGEKRSTVEIAELLDEFEHECYMLCVEASETRARDDVVRESYERILDEFAGRIAATVGSERELIDLAHNAWSIALCAMQGMPIPAKWGDAVERGLREHGVDVDGGLAAFEVIDDE